MSELVLTKCSGTTVHGKPCGNIAKRDGLCVFHHPETRDARAEEAKKKGAAKRSQRTAGGATLDFEITSSADLRRAVGLAMKGVSSGQWSPAQADAYAKLCIQMRAAIKAEREEEGDTAGLAALTDEQLAELAANQSSHIRLVKEAEG